MAKRPRERKLKFSMPIATMLERAQVFHAHFVADQAVLALQDPELTTIWGDDFQTAITAALESDTPDVARAELKGLTASVDDKMSLARDAYGDLMFYVGKAFPGDEAKKDEFGHARYRQASDSHQRMITMLEVAQKSITKYQTELTNKGYTLDKITAFGTLLTSLYGANSTQEVKKDANPTVSQDYHAKLNAVWDRMVMLHNAAVLVFQNDYAKYIQ